MRVVRGIVYGGVIAVFALLLLEGALRLLIPAFDPSGQIQLVAGNKERPILGAPNTERRQTKNTGDYDVKVRFNRYGLRDSKDLAGSDDTAWFVVGDSFSFGWGVEETARYSDVLARILGQPIYNIAIPSGDLRTYAKMVNYAVHKGARVQRLLIGICMENDLHAYTEDGELASRPDSSRRSVAILKNFLVTHSAVYVALTTLTHRYTPLRSIATKLGLLVPNLEGMSRNYYSASIIEAAVRQLKPLVDSYRVTVILIPSRGLWVGDNQDQEDQVHRAFLRALKKAGIDVLDLRPVFEIDGDPMKYHFRYDGHWNAAGHSHAAKALAGHLLPAVTINQ